jgi:hypothetical protein
VILGTVLLASLTLGPVDCAAVPASDSLKATWQAGVTFGEFLAAAVERREQWIANYSTGAAVDATMVSRAAAVKGSWRLLVVAIDSCSDSVSTVPWIARLVDQLDSVEMRIVNPETGRWIMEANRTPDGRAATPTVLLVDDEWQVRGCFIERPVALRAFMDTLPDNRRSARKMDWYHQDAGRETVREIVEMMEAATRGEMICK